MFLFISIWTGDQDYDVVATGRTGIQTIGLCQPGPLSDEQTSGSFRRPVRRRAAACFHSRGDSS